MANRYLCQLFIENNKCKSDPIFKNLFYWRIVSLQCCVNLYCTEKWFSNTYIYIYLYILFHILSHHGFSQDTEYISLCYTTAPCCLPILYMIVASAAPKCPVLPSPLPCPWPTTTLVSLSVRQFQFHKNSFVSHFKLRNSILIYFALYIFLEPKVLAKKNRAL